MRRAKQLAALGRAYSERHLLRPDQVLDGYLLGAGHLSAGEADAAIEALRGAHEANMAVRVRYAYGYPWAPELAEALFNPNGPILRLPD